MKGIVKITLAFVLGIIVTTTIILPKMNQQTEPAEIPPTPNLEAQIQAAVNEAVTLALAKPEEPVEIAQIEVEPVSETVEATEEVVAEVEITPEPTPSPEPEKVEVKVETTPKQTSSPQVKTAEPEYFYEDGNKYAIINGHKTYIAPDDEPAVSSDFYDWANDPAGQIKGPFN